MDGEVLVDAFFLRSMVPMMISRHYQELLNPFRISTEIAVRPCRVKGDKNQVGQDDRLRKSKHERGKDKPANQCVIHEVRA